MASSKPLTREELVSVLTEMKIATKDDILASERRMKLRMGKIRNDLAQKIAHVSLNSPTIKEFDELKDEFKKAKSYI